MTAIIKPTSWPIFRDIQKEVNQLYDENIANIAIAQMSPKVDIKEEGDKFKIEADLPGLDPKDIEISVENNVLTIKGERKLEQRLKEENYSRVERFSGTFYRQFTLPESVDSQRIQAKGRHGVLELFIPKKEPHIPQKIAVTVEEG